MPEMQKNGFVFLIVTVSFFSVAWLSFSVQDQAATNIQQMPIILLNGIISNLSNENVSHASFRDSRLPNGKNSREYLQIVGASSHSRKHASGASSEMSDNHTWQELPNHVCMLNSRVFTTREVIQNTVSDGGGNRKYKFEVSPPTGPVCWRRSLILAWFTCEGNLHHFLEDTLHPLVQSLDSVTDFDDNDENPVLGIVGSTGLSRWKQNEKGCHGSTYYPLLSAFKIEPVIFSFPNPPDVEKTSDFRNGDDSGYIYPGYNENWRPDVVYCFRSTVQVQPGGRSQALVSHLKSWSNCSSDSSTAVKLSIVQRMTTRKILNIDELVSAAKAIIGIKEVKVLALETMTLKEQIQEMACGYVIVAGVHGAGLEWVTLWEHLAERAALIEWGWKGWESFYAHRVRGDTVTATFRKIADKDIHEPCSVPRRSNCCCPYHDKNCSDGTCAFPTKFVDIDIDVELWKQDLQLMLAFVSV